MSVCLRAFLLSQILLFSSLKDFNNIFIAALVSETPPRLEGLNVVDQGSTSVTLLWTRPKTPIMLPITSFRLIVKDTKTNEKLEKDVSGASSRYVVKELKPKSTYLISIYAINKEGQGEISSFPIAETLEANITPGTIIYLYFVFNITNPVLFNFFISNIFAS